jgi:DNA helicase HerA-like ATPase
MEELPEQGDAPLPKLIFFFDEAHLLFDNAPKALLERITQVVRLIRSKGVGVFFVTQYPNDVPDEVIGQLGNRIQHALRAYTPRDRKALRAAAETFRPNPAFDSESTISELGVGQALISTLDAKGVPGMVERTLVAPPRSRIGPVSEEERLAIIARSPIKGLYDQMVDRESAYEMLKQRETELTEARQKAEQEAQQQAERERQEKAAARQKKTTSSGSRRQGIGESFAKSMMRSIGSSIGRRIARGILGSIISGR